MKKLHKTMKDAKINEENSNQILDFTREVKNLPEKDKIKIRGGSMVNYLL